MNILETHNRISNVYNKVYSSSYMSTENRTNNIGEYEIYMIEALPILDQYKRELLKPIEFSFMGPTISTKSDELVQLEEKYLTIIHRMFPEMIEYKKTKDITIYNTACFECSSINEESLDNGISVCGDCGLEKDSNDYVFTYKDTDNANTSSKYTYDRRTHFKDCMNQFQGKQNSLIKQEVYDELYKIIDLYGLSHKGDLSKKVKYDKVTKQHITMFLKELGYTKHYEDVNLIYHVITDSKLPDISHLEEVLMNEFTTLSDLYNELYVKTRKIDRKNFINTQYVLFQLLKHHKFKCSVSDFNFLKTMERKVFHDDICSELFKRLNWNFTHLF